MADTRLGRTDRQVFGMGSGPPVNRHGFRRIIQWSAGTVSIDVTDLLRRNPRTLASCGHCGQSGVAPGMRLREMVHVGNRAVTDNLAQNLRTAPAGRL